MLASVRSAVRSRLFLVLVGIAIGAAAIAGPSAWASLGTGSSYTGCLGAASGQIYNVKSGAAPLAACAAPDVQIKLSGGDITAVTASTGLTGGATHGAASLGIAKAYQLPQGCSAGEFPTPTGEGTWTCAAQQGFPDAALPSGRTLTGTFTAFNGAIVPEPAGGYYAEADISFAEPLATAPTGHYLAPGAAATTDCPGSASNPEAAAGQLCLYASNAPATGFSFFLDSTNDTMGVSRFGTTVGFLTNGTRQGAEAEGTWAVTAP